MSFHRSRKKKNNEGTDEKLRDRFMRFFGQPSATPSTVDPSSVARSGDAYQANYTQSSHPVLASLQHPGNTTDLETKAPVVVGSSVLPSNTPKPEKDNCGNSKNPVGRTWGGLEVALQLLEKSSDVFPPLKSAVGGLITCLDTIKTALHNDEDCDQLAAELKSMVETVNQYAGELDSEDMNGSIASITSSIEKEVVRIKEKQNRGKLKQVLRATQNEADIIDSYRRIEASFRQLQNNANLWTLRKMNRQHESALLQALLPEEDARYNSAYSTTIKRRGCTAETREVIQEDFQRWIRDSKAVPIYWLNGMAGTGKTTIAYSLCEWLGTNKLLGANFFCSRAKDTCRDVNKIIPTIACQLGRYSPAFRSAVCKILDGDLGTSKLNITEQFEKLIKRPLLEAKPGMPDGVVIILDALDECTEVDGVRLFVETVLRSSKGLPVKFFIASRPEPTIRNKMQSSVDNCPEILLLHDIEESIVAEDIKKYLRESLSSLSPTPSDQQIEQLAQDSGKLFIYAATVVRYILPKNPSVDPSARLAAVLSINSQSANNSQSARKYKDLDKLYDIILTAAFNDLEEEEEEAIRVVLQTVICAKEPMTTQTLASLLALMHPRVTFALQPLHSVLHVSGAHGLVSVLHASFSDYMLDETRSKGFHCDQATHSYLLASRCFEVMRQQLRFNIADMGSSFVLHKELPALEGQINSSISSVLFYACHYWSDHIQLTKSSDSLIQQLANFLSAQLLFWLEVLNLKQCFVGRAAMTQAQDWLQNADSDVQELAADALNFVAWFYAGGQSPAPHPYGFALPFCVRFRATTYFLVDFDHRAHAFTLLLGSAFGVTQDSVWEVLDNVAGGDEAILGQATAGPPDVSSAHLTPEEKDGTSRFWERCEASVDRGAGKGRLYARLVQSGLGNQLKVFFSPELKALILPQLEGGSEGRPESREGGSGYILHETKDTADLVVEIHRPVELGSTCGQKQGLAEEAQVVFHLRRPEFEKYGVVVRPRCMPAYWNDIEAALFAAARWNWHLQQTNTIPTRAPVSMEMFKIKLDGTYDFEGNPSWAVADEHGDLGWAGVVDLELSQDMDLDMFAVRLRSRASVPLYVRMFYFDATNFSISEHYASEAGCKRGPSLPPSGTLIFGHPETSVPLAFALEPGNLTEVGFLKVFWSRDALDIGYMAQPSVFETPWAVGNQKSSTESGNGLKQEWGSVVFTVVQRSSKR